MRIMKFRDYVRLRETNVPGYHLDGPGGAYLTSDFSGSEAIPNSHSYHLPSIDMEIPNNIPTKTIQSLINVINKNKNPIFVGLEDGTKIFLTWDEFKRINPAPEVGKKAMITFQINDKDKDNTPSQIQKFVVY